MPEPFRPSVALAAPPTRPRLARAGRAKGHWASAFRASVAFPHTGSCGHPSECPLDTSLERPPAGRAPPANKCPPRPGSVNRLLLANGDEFAALEALDVAVCPGAHPIRRSGVVGELSEPLLHRFQGSLAPGPHMVREHAGENLEGVPQPLPLQSQVVEVGLVPKPTAFGVVEKPPEQRPEPTLRVVSQWPLAPLACGDPPDERVHPAMPVGVRDRRMNLFYRLPAADPFSG